MTVTMHATSAMGAVLLALQPPAAPEAVSPPDPAETVVVTGTRDREAQAQSFVRALTPTSQDSIPRLIDEVCPAVSGLKPEVAEAVAARIRKVAVAVRMPVGGQRCLPNVVVLVKPDKQAFLEQLRKRRPNYFNGVEAAEMRRVFRSAGPVAVWRNEGPVDADGIPLRWDDTLGYVNNSTAPPSRFSTSARRGTESAVLLIEAAAVTGLTATQLADYAAMRLLARADPARLPAAPPPTILTLIDAPADAAVPVTLTAWDLGLLRGLSLTSPELAVGSQRAQIVREVGRQVSQPAGAER